VYHSADCDTNHSLVAAKIKIRPKQLHVLKKKCQPKIDVSKASCPERNQAFIAHLEESLPREQAQCTEDKWNGLRTAIHSAAVLAYGKRSAGTQTGLRLTLEN
jgi:hypothetical protein